MFSPAQSGRIYVVDATACFPDRLPQIVDTIKIPAGIMYPQRFPESFARIHSGELCVAWTCDEVVVDHPCRLHQRITDCRADELESAL
jgi:hypothetical protein